MLEGSLGSTCSAAVGGTARQAGTLSVAVRAQATQQAAPAHAAVWGDGTLRTLLSLFLSQLRLEGQTMKLQANAGTPPPLTCAPVPKHGLRSGVHWTAALAPG